MNADRETCDALRKERIALKGMQWRCGDCSRVYQKIRRRVVRPKCPDCGSTRASAYWLLWFLTINGAVYNTGAVESMAAARAILEKCGLPDGEYP